MVVLYATEPHLAGRTLSYEEAAVNEQKSKKILNGNVNANSFK
jgi:hypothetical protein